MPDIDFQKIELNLIPKKGDEPVIFYASQYETARSFIAALMWGESEFAPGDDCWAEIDIRKNDDNLVVITDDVTIDNNEVSVILPVQALTCIGNNLGQVKIYDADEQLVAALNFILEVQADPSAGGVTSETAIDNLTQQIEEITQQVIGDDYYNKTEVDDLLDDKADKATTYTKTQVDSALALKADKSDTYTKTQVDTALAVKADTTYVDSGLALKANAADVYTKTQTYSQAEVDALIDNIFPTLTASGPIASFTTALSKPLVSVTADPLATTITRCGVNLWELSDDTKNDKTQTSTYNYENNGVKVTASGQYARVSYVYKVKVGQPYTISFYGSGTANFLNVYYSNSTSWGDSYGRSVLDSTRTKYTKTITPTTDTLFIGFYATNTGTTGDMVIEDFMLEVGSSASDDFQEYNGQSVPVADATTLVTQSGINNVFADVGDVTVQYKYMSM